MVATFDLEANIIVKAVIEHGRGLAISTVVALLSRPGLIAQAEALGARKLVPSARSWISAPCAQPLSQVSPGSYNSPSSDLPSAMLGSCRIEISNSAGTPSAPAYAPYPPCAAKRRQRQFRRLK